MGGFITALALFGVIAGIVAAMRAQDGTEAYADSPRTAPNPGSRDLYTLTGGTLNRAYVPSWG